MNAREKLAWELSKTLEHDVAEVFAERHAARVKVNAAGEPDAESVAQIAQELVAGAPSKFKRASAGDVPSAHDDLREFYANIRKNEKARQAAAVGDPVAEAARRMGSSPVAEAKRRLPKVGGE